MIEASRRVPGRGRRNPPSRGRVRQMPTPDWQAPDYWTAPAVQSPLLPPPANSPPTPQVMWTITTHRWDSPRFFHELRTVLAKVHGRLLIDEHRKSRANLTKLALIGQLAFVEHAALFWLLMKFTNLASYKTRSDVKRYADSLTDPPQSINRRRSCVTFKARLLLSHLQ